MSSVWSYDRPKIVALGVSQKGQYVALEEYGYNAHQNIYYAKFRLINVWKKTDVIPSVEWKKIALAPMDLVELRHKLKKYAAYYMAKYKILPRNQRKLAYKFN